MSFESAKAEVIVDLPCELGENPLWHPDEQAVYWTDIEGGIVYRYDPRSQKVTHVYELSLIHI